MLVLVAIVTALLVALLLGFVVVKVTLSSYLFVRLQCHFDFISSHALQHCIVCGLMLLFSQSYRDSLQTHPPPDNAEDCTEEILQDERKKYRRREFSVLERKLAPVDIFAFAQKCV